MVVSDRRAALDRADRVVTPTGGLVEADDTLEALLLRSAKMRHLREVGTGAGQGVGVRVTVTDRSHWASLALLHPRTARPARGRRGRGRYAAEISLRGAFFQRCQGGPRTHQGGVRCRRRRAPTAMEPGRPGCPAHRLPQPLRVDRDTAAEDLAWIEESDLSSIELPQGIPAGRWRDLLRQSLREDADPRLIPVHRPPWSRRGWSPRMRAWVGGALEVLGRPPLGTLEQVRVWGVSTLWRGRTEAGLVYFKAVPPLFSAEGAITSTLERLFPGGCRRCSPSTPAGLAAP